MMDVLDPERLTGNVGVVSQSGSICIGLLYDTRRYGYSHVISTGNEAVTTTAQYIEYLVDDPDTTVIALFAETVRAPDRFVAALDRAFDAGKPVVIVRAGRSARAAAAIQTHTGGLAGGSRVAFGRAAGAPRDRGCQSRGADRGLFRHARAGAGLQGGRLAVVTGSGGHAELMLDLAHDAGLDLPPLPEGARRTIEAQGRPHHRRRQSDRCLGSERFCRELHAGHKGSVGHAVPMTRWSSPSKATTISRSTTKGRMKS